MKARHKVQLLALITIIFWGSAFPITKIATEEFTPSSLAFLRCIIASTFLLILGYFNHMKLPKWKDLYLFVLAGGAGFALYMLFFNTGLLSLTAATSSVIIAITPVITAVSARFLYKEKIHATGWICIGTAFMGVLVLLLWDGILSLNIGAVFTIMAAIVFCCYNLIGRKLASRGYSPIQIVTYSMVSGGLLLSFTVVESVGQLGHASMSALLALLYLGIFSSGVGYLLWGKALALAERTSDVTNFMFVTPFVSAVIGMISLGEVPPISTFVGGFIIVISVVAFNFKKNKS